MEIQTGGGVLGLGIQTGEGVWRFWKSGWRGVKKHAICRGGVDFFWNNPMLIFLSKNSACNSCKPNEKTNIAFMGEGGALIVMLLPTC